MEMITLRQTSDILLNFQGKDQMWMISPFLTLITYLYQARKRPSM
jgi:hypothetical protein